MTKLIIGEIDFIDESTAIVGKIEGSLYCSNPDEAEEIGELLVSEYHFLGYIVPELYTGKIIYDLT